MTSTAPSRRPTGSAGRVAEAGVDVLIRRWQRTGDRRARHEVIERHLPLARRLASRYRNPYESIEDLTQVATLGLIGAVDRFDPERGARFESFAVPTMLGELKRYYRDTGWTAHVPRRAKEDALLIDRAMREFSSRHGRSPRVDELAAELGITVETVLTGLDAGMAHYSTSLYAPVAGADPDADGALALVDHLGGIDERLDLVDAKLSLADAIARLPYLERTALRMRMDADLRQSDIAQRLECSQMQVSRLLRRAAERVRELVDPAL